MPSKRRSILDCWPILGKRHELQLVQTADSKIDEEELVASLLNLPVDLWRLNIFPFFSPLELERVLSRVSKHYRLLLEDDNTWRYYAFLLDKVARPLPVQHVSWREQIMFTSGPFVHAGAHMTPFPDSNGETSAPVTPTIITQEPNSTFPNVLLCHERKTFQTTIMGPFPDISCQLQIRYKPKSSSSPKSSNGGEPRANLKIYYGHVFVNIDGAPRPLFRALRRREWRDSTDWVICECDLLDKLSGRKQLPCAIEMEIPPSSSSSASTEVIGGAGGVVGELGTPQAKDSTAYCLVDFIRLVPAHPNPYRRPCLVSAARMASRVPEALQDFVISQSPEWWRPLGAICSLPNVDLPLTIRFDGLLPGVYEVLWRASADAPWKARVFHNASAAVTPAGRRRRPAAKQTRDQPSSPGTAVPAPQKKAAPAMVVRFKDVPLSPLASATSSSEAGGAPSVPSLENSSLPCRCPTGASSGAEGERLSTSSSRRSTPKLLRHSSSSLSPSSSSASEDQGPPTAALRRAFPTQGRGLLRRLVSSPPSSPLIDSHQFWGCSSALLCAALAVSPTEDTDACVPESLQWNLVSRHGPMKRPMDLKFSWNGAVESCPSILIMDDPLLILPPQKSSKADVELQIMSPPHLHIDVHLEQVVFAPMKSSSDCDARAFIAKWKELCQQSFSVSTSSTSDSSSASSPTSNSVNSAGGVLLVSGRAFRRAEKSPLVYKAVASCRVGIEYMVIWCFTKSTTTSTSSSSYSSTSKLSVSTSAPMPSYEKCGGGSGPIDSNGAAASTSEGAGVASEINLSCHSAFLFGGCDENGDNDDFPLPLETSSNSPLLLSEEDLTSSSPYQSAELSSSSSSSSSSLQNPPFQNSPRKNKHLIPSAIPRRRKKKRLIRGGRMTPPTPSASSASHHFNRLRLPPNSYRPATTRLSGLLHVPDDSQNYFIEVHSSDNAARIELRRSPLKVQITQGHEHTDTGEILVKPQETRNTSGVEAKPRRFHNLKPGWYEVVWCGFAGGWQQLRGFVIHEETSCVHWAVYGQSEIWRKHEAIFEVRPSLETNSRGAIELTIMLPKHLQQGSLEEVSVARLPNYASQCSWSIG